MPYAPSVYIRRHRKHWELSQEALADLLGTTQSPLSRYEDGKAVPDLATALGLQVVFGVSPRALFPSFYARVEEQVMGRAAHLDRTLDGRTDYRAQRLRRLLEGMAHRARISPDAA